MRIKAPAVDAGEGYRNGYGKPRRVAMMAGTITGRRPFVVFVAPLHLPGRVLGLDPPKAIVFITDPERTHCYLCARAR